MRGSLALFAVCATALAGCATVQVGVTNPLPGMTTVAVAPFLNLSAERAVDGRRFALAYQAELQKVPGFQVLPVGVVERAIIDLNLDLSGPDDALKLAKELGADAVVVGAVTDYNPYYPPRIGLQVSWFSPKAWPLVPGIPIEPVVIRGQTPEVPPLPAPPPEPGMSPEPAMSADNLPASGPLLLPAPEYVCPPGSYHHGSCPPEFCLPPGCPPSGCPPFDMTGFPGGPARVAGGDPRRPIMSYTRIFDGADADLTALLRDYVALSGDLRSGGWEAYLHRSEDFIRFTAHRMIVEMLTLHGGQAKVRYVFKLGTHRHD